jgi:DNA-binding MarR family transcriptional regulator
MDTNDTLVDTLEEAFGIIRQRMMGNLFIYIRDKGLSMGQFGALTHIFRSGRCGVSDIGSDLGVTNSAASQMLERLVQLKLITRSEDPLDRRSKQIVLTEKGQQILQDLSLANRNWLEDLSLSMSDEEKQQVEQGITILVAKARQSEVLTN